MGSSPSALPEPIQLNREVLTCDSRGRAHFRYENTSGQPGRPGRYLFRCLGASMNEFRCNGLMVNGTITKGNFPCRILAGHKRVIKYRPGRRGTPHCKGFEGGFTAVPHKKVVMEMWWYPFEEY